MLNHALLQSWGGTRPLIVFAVHTIATIMPPTASPQIAPYLIAGEGRRGGERGDKVA